MSKKSRAYGVELTLPGMESQEHIHYAMPMRVMGYDYGTYRKQYDSNAKKYKNSDGMEEEPGNPWISGQSRGAGQKKMQGAEALPAFCIFCTSAVVIALVRIPLIFYVIAVAYVIFLPLLLHM